jgi:basic membrane protein A and related proteins
LSKRSLLGLTAVGGAAALVGCGKKEEPAPQAAAPAARRRLHPRRQARAAEDRLGLRRPGGRRRLDLCARPGPQGGGEAEFGDKVKTTFVEKVPEAPTPSASSATWRPGQQADLRHHLRLHGADAEGGAEFPDVKFEHATGYKQAANMRTYDSRFYQDAYMAGIIAGA